MCNSYLPFNKTFVCFVILLAIIIPGCRKHKHLTIVCIGDSLTQCGGEGGKYTDWLQKWLPSHAIINKGIGGDTLAGGRARFQRDVLAMKPDVVVIELGANDFWQMKRPVKELRQDLEYMVAEAKTAGAQVVIASCFGKRDYMNETKVEYGAERYGFADRIWLMEEDICIRHKCFYVPNMQIDIKPNGKAPYWGDKNHPNKAGNRYVAKRILSELNKALTAAEEKGN